MAARMQKQLTHGGEWTEVDLASLAAAGGKLNLSYTHAAQLSFTCIAAEHTLPIERLAFIRFWIEGEFLDDGTTAQDEDHPLFEGFVETVGPGGDANKVSSVAYDPTFRANREITFMSAAYTNSGSAAVEAIGAIPRVVYNATDEGDADYGQSLGQNASIGYLIGGILDYCRVPLWYLNACPGPDSPEQAFNSADLSGITFQPQEKIVWESESVRAATERLQRYEPRARMIWEPGSRLWRYRDITVAPEVPLRLNDPTVDFPVLSLDLSPSLDRCFTAIKIYGPPVTSTQEFTWIHPDVAPDGWTNTLAPVGDPVTIETVGLTSTVSTFRAWQIVDTAKRRGARLLPDWYALRTSEFIWDEVKEPQFLLSWDGGNTWIGAANCFLNFLNGSATFPVTLPYVTLDQQFGQTAEFSGQHYFAPNAAKLIYAPFGDALSVRVPESGFEGTAYDIAGLQLQKIVYDEQVAVGMEYGAPVTSDARLAQIAVYGRALLDKSKDMVWTGGCVLDGLDFSWCRLNRRVTFEASDGSGGTLLTGWEMIHAWVTDVEYDFTEQTTTLTFSSDRAELMGEDPAMIKERLKIRALEQVQYEQFTNLWRTETNWRGETFQELAGVQVTSGFQYVDTVTGQTVATH